MQGKSKFTSVMSLYSLVLLSMSLFLVAEANGDIFSDQQEIESLIEAGQIIDAQDEAEQLKIDYSQDPCLPSVLYSIAERYRWSEKYDQAKDMHQQIAQNYSGNPYADKAELAYSRTQVLSLIASHDYTEAQTALNQLITEFSGDADLPETLYWVGRGFGWSNRYEEEKSAYQQLAQNYPESQYASKALLGHSRAHVQSLIMSEEPNQAQEALDELIVNFSGHNDLPYTLYSIAIRWVWSGDFSAAEGLYEQISQQHAGTQFAQKAQADLSITQDGIGIFALIESGQDQAAQSAINQLVTNFNSHELLPHTIFACGERYYKRAHDKRNGGYENEAGQDFSKAIEMWEMIIEELPASNTTPEGYYHIALAYRQLGEYDLAIENYTKVVEAYPDYRLAWDAQFMVGNCYEKLLKAELLSRPTARPLITSAYEAVLEKYPDCKAAGAAQHRLAALAGFTANPEPGTWVVDSNAVD